MASVIEALLRLPEDVLLWPLIMFEPRGGLNGITPAAKNTVLGFGAEHNIISNKQLSRLLAFVNIKKKLKFIRNQLDSSGNPVLEKAKTCYDKFIQLSIYLLLYSKEFACGEVAGALSDKSDDSNNASTEPKKESWTAWFFSPITEAAQKVANEIENKATDAAAEACAVGDAPNEDQINAAAKEYYDSLIIFIDELQQTYTKFSEIKADDSEIKNAGEGEGEGEGAPRDQLSLELSKSPQKKIGEYLGEVDGENGFSKNQIETLKKIISQVPEAQNAKVKNLISNQALKWAASSNTAKNTAREAREARTAIKTALNTTNSAASASDSGDAAGAQGGGRLHKTKKKHKKHNARLLSKRKKYTMQKAMQKAKQKAMQKARSRKIHRAISRTAKRLFKSQQNFLQLN